MFETLYSRPVWLGLLARASGVKIAACLQAAPLLPGFTRLRGPESGMSMVRGRAGGGGAAFNLGEMTISRCSIRDEAGRVGHGYAAGRDHAQVELIARLDAVLQERALYAAYHEAVLAPLAAAQAARRAEIAEKAAATGVKFFTMAAMRG
jgi:alpha-D-ribose 1-methylphosphonate 5-triphosphate synthase subunit PhnG